MAREPNTQANLVDLGYPRALAGAQREAARKAIRSAPRSAPASSGAPGVCAQELLIRPAQGLPDQPVRAARGRPRGVLTVRARGRYRASAFGIDPRAPGGGRWQSRCTTASMPRWVRPQSRRHAADRDRQRHRTCTRAEAVAYHEEPCTPWCAGSVSDGNMQEGRSAATRERVGARPKGPGQVRHPRREIKNVNSSACRKGHRVRDRAPDRAREWSGRHGAGDAAVYDPGRG